MNRTVATAIVGCSLVYSRASREQQRAAMASAPALAARLLPIGRFAETKLFDGNAELARIIRVMRNGIRL
jgi:hypothetical protein